jgi:hypothetical protein
MMARGPSPFKQRELTRAIKAAVAAGMEVARYEIEAGKITIFPGKPGLARGHVEAVGSQVVAEDDENSWDEVLRGNDQAKAR